jgi:hypothetical protein
MLAAEVDIGKYGTFKNKRRNLRFLLPCFDGKRHCQLQPPMCLVKRWANITRKAEKRWVILGPGQITTCAKRNAMKGNFRQWRLSKGYSFISIESEIELLEEAVSIFTTRTKGHTNWNWQRIGLTDYILKLPHPLFFLRLLSLTCDLIA